MVSMNPFTEKCSKTRTGSAPFVTAPQGQARICMSTMTTSAALFVACLTFGATEGWLGGIGMVLCCALLLIIWIGTSPSSITRRNLAVNAGERKEIVDDITR